MGSYEVDTGGFGWLLVVMVGNGVVPDGYRWLPLVMNGFDLLGLLRDGCKKSKWKFKMDFSIMCMWNSRPPPPSWKKPS